MKFFNCIIILLIAMTCNSVTLANQGNDTCSELYQPTRYGVLGYFGKITQNTLGQVVGMNFSLDEERLYSLEFTRTFASDSAIRQYFGPLFSRTWLNLNVTYHDDPTKGNILELAPYLSAHWHLIRWPQTLDVYFGVGEGASWVSNIPNREYRNSTSPKKLLNYLMFEFCFVHPKYQQFELVARIHHRSGVFGLYNANNSGATSVGIAVRYFFYECA